MVVKAAQDNLLYLSDGENFYTSYQTRNNEGKYRLI